MIICFTNSLRGVPPMCIQVTFLFLRAPPAAGKACSCPAPPHACANPLQPLNDGSGPPTPRCSWMRCSGHPQHPNIEDPAEQQPRGWGLQSLHPWALQRRGDIPTAGPWERAQLPPERFPPAHRPPASGAPLQPTLSYRE